MSTYLRDVLEREALYEPGGWQVVGTPLSYLARIVPAPAENPSIVGAG